ncbi:hypothetical protein [Pedobacter frigidisoli]|uniref:hypothetical protein n=1 Tax=Pedobacter frigidisoli TaxID=2530455 RepID=UPI0029314023|nr:hypothetical protein [Pedobacter frigidisoli]
MKSNLLIIVLSILLPHLSYAQLPSLRIIDGTLRTVESGMLVVPPKDKYKKIIDSLDQNLKKSPNDTTSLFYRSLLYYSYNQKMAEPAQTTKGTLENLLIAKNMIERAISEKMINVNTKILRAQIYAELCYRFSGDESWMFTPAVIQSRRKLFETSKAKANDSYDELIKSGISETYVLEKKKVKDEYPIKP